MLSPFIITRRSTERDIKYQDKRLNMKKMNFVYNKEEDILLLSDPSKEVKYSLGVGDMFVIDFDSNDKVVGLEILDASETIFGVSKKILENIKEVYIGAQYRQDIIVVGYRIFSIAKEPISDSIKMPIAVRA